MTVRILGFVLVNVSATWLCCVSAGGAYCAKTARARAAALGLHLPRVHADADLSKLSSYAALQPHEPQSHHYHQLFQNNAQPPVKAYRVLYNPSKVFPYFHPSGNRAPIQANPQSGLSGADPLNERQSNFAQVKRVVSPLSQALPLGQANFLDGASESQRSGLGFAFNGRDAGVFDPTRRGVSGVTGRFHPLSSGYGWFYMQSPVGAGSKPNAVHSMGERGSQLPGGHSAWPFARTNRDIISTNWKKDNTLDT